MTKMNLTEIMIRDYKTCVKSLDFLKREIAEWGPIVDIKIGYYANGIDIADKTYTFENGMRTTLSAYRAGVDSLLAN